MSERVLELERKVEALRQEVEYLTETRQTMRMARRSRIARTFDNGAYPPNSSAAGILYPIIFLDGAETDRQVADRRQAKNLASGYLAVGSKIVVTEVDGFWFTAIGSATAPNVSGVKLAKTNAEIPAISGNTPGSGAVTVWTYTNGDIAATAEVISDARNWADYAIPSGELVVLVQETVSLRWHIISDGVHKIEGASPGGGPVTVDLFDYDTLKFASTGATPVVEKAGKVVTVTHQESTTLRRGFITTASGLQLTVSNGRVWGTCSFALQGPSLVVNSVTQANPAVVTTAVNHGFSNGDNVRFQINNGMVELSWWKDFVIGNVTATTFELTGTDSTGFAAFTGGWVSLSEQKTLLHEHGSVGRELFKHDHVWVQKRFGEPAADFDLVSAGIRVTMEAQGQEIIPADGGWYNIRLRSTDGYAPILGKARWQWINPSSTELGNGANLIVEYWQFVPVEDGGEAGREHRFKIINANCDDVNTVS